MPRAEYHARDFGAKKPSISSNSSVFSPSFMMTVEMGLMFPRFHPSPLAISVLKDKGLVFHRFQVLISAFIKELFQNCWGSAETRDRNHFFAAKTHILFRGAKPEQMVLVEKEEPPIPRRIAERLFLCIIIFAPPSADVNEQ